MSVIIKTTGNAGTKYYYGPFHDEDQAKEWANSNLNGFGWNVEDLIRPGSTYLACSVEDVVDFIESHVGDTYVTIDDVNWVVT